MLKKRAIAILMIFTVLPSVFISYGFSVSAVRITDESGATLKNYYSSSDITTPLKRAFEYTAANASRRNLLKISISKGTYDVKKTLYLSSYTTVDLGSATLKNSNAKRGNIFKSPEDKSYPAYSSLRECVVQNGTLDGNYNQNKSCIVRLCHAENIVIKNVAFRNNYYSHHCELAACKNVKFYNCTFTGQVSDLNVSSSEAVQIDILDRVHFYGFTSYDNTMNDGITIEKCVFKNVYRGVGTHNYFKDKYHTNITVTDCTFENITDCAVSAVNFKNLEIKNNNFQNCKYSAFYRDNGK